MKVYNKEDDNISHSLAVVVFYDNCIPCTKSRGNSHPAAVSCCVCCVKEGKKNLYGVEKMK